MDSKERGLWHQSGVNQAGEPFVQLILDGKVIGQMSPEEARDHARAITEAAEASEQDAFLLHWAQTRFGVDLEHAMGVIVEFRKYREERGKRGGPTKAADWVMPKPKQQS